MKILFTLLFTLLTTRMYAQENNERVAILVAQYGSTVEETRRKTVDVLFRDIKEANPDAEVREAYIADAVRKKMDRMGVHKDSPEDALLRLHLDGYKKVIVQPTLLLDGTEMAELRRQVSKVEVLFENITVGTPLLNTIEDFERLTDVLVASTSKSKGSIVFVGHGNPYASTGAYSMLDTMLKEKGHNNIFVSTIEGYPTANSTVQQLKREKVKNVTLIPLLLVCGNHTLNDVNGSFRTTLETAGFKVDILLRGLAEVPTIRNLYVEKLRGSIH